MNEREILNFNTLWRYSPHDHSGAEALLFDDSGFEKVSIPHANTVLKTHKGNDFLTQIESYRFISWYRRHFTLSQKYAGKRVIIGFEGVATVCEVYINGIFAGSHKGAYTSFSFDITDHIIFGGDNVIAIKVDSTRRSDIPPEGGEVDYCLFGGIVRNVTLTILNPLYIENAFITTPDLSRIGGTVNAAATIKNLGDSKTVALETVVFDADGNEVARGISGKKTVLTGSQTEFKAETAEIGHPRLWSVDDPYLYTAEVRVLYDGNILDNYKVRIGLRNFEFTDNGFYLNGEKLVLRGVNRHEQWPWQGRAIPDKLQIRDADLIKYTGFNAVRCSHYPQSPAFLSRCDEIGLIVFEEAPGWQHIGDDAWQEIYKNNIKEMILRDRNHPSIATWGVRVNESADNRELYTSTTALSKTLDHTRPTHGVRRSEHYECTEHIEDIFCVNYHYPETPRFAPFVITEHSWEHWTDGCGLPNATDAQAAAFTESFANVVNYYYKNDFCLGGFAWSMFDYDNEVNYTKTGHVFYSGMYDIFRLDKPVSHFYRSQKDPSEEVVLFIANYNTKNSPSDVEVYSNCDEVELFVNGASLGRIAPNLYMNVPHPAFKFTSAAPGDGALRAIGYINGKACAEALRRSPGAAAKLSLAPDYTSITADGSDITSVTIELTDKNGTRLPYAENIVSISVIGPAEFIGENPIALEGGRAAFLIKSLYKRPGIVTCTVHADGLEDGKSEITVVDYDDENTVPSIKEE